MCMCAWHLLNTSPILNIQTIRDVPDMRFRWRDIRPLFAIRFRFRQKYWPAPDSAAG